MEITYLNHSSFLIKNNINGKNISVLTDPFDDSVGMPFKKVSADLVLISHLHNDHSNVAGVIDLTAVDLKNEGFEAFLNKPFLIKRPGEFEVKGVRVKGIQSFHDDKNGANRGANIIYTISVDGIKVCHLGDLGHLLTEKQLEDIGNVDVLLIPVGGDTTINAETACEVISQIEPSYVIPMHYKTKKHNATTFEKLEGVEAFLKEFGKEDTHIYKDKFVITKTSGEETQLVLLKPLY